MDDEFSFLFDDEDGDEPSTALVVVEEEGSPSVTLADVEAFLQYAVPEARDFISENWMGKWESAEKYFNGENDVPKVRGRSQANETPVRDAIRHLKTSAMDVLTTSKDIVKFKSSNPAHKTACGIQTKFISQRFWRCGGFLTSIEVCQDAMLKNIGIGKAVVNETYKTRYFDAEALTEEDIAALKKQDDISIMSQTPREGAPIPLYDLELSSTNLVKELRFDHVPLYGFFVSETANTEFDARVIGECRSMPIGDVISEYGLAPPKGGWETLDDEDPEDYNASGESRRRRGFDKMRHNNEHERDPLMKHILLTEVYARFDLMGTGIPQLYRFFLGGTNYILLDHELVDDVPYRRFLIDPQPSSFFGKSIYDILKENQDLLTSLIRLTVDNAHSSNNRRLGVHETMVNMADVLSPKVGAPIRVRAPGMIQEIGTEPMTGALLPLLQDLRLQGETKSGVTRAAMGLDPDAMQSTDKEAVRNTIAAQQGLVRFIVRCLVETGFVGIFRRMLVLSMRNLDRKQWVNIDGREVQFDQWMLDPDLDFEVNAGTGTGNAELQIAFLDQAIAYQQQLIAEWGPANPLANLSHHFRAIQDKADLMGVTDATRYFAAIPDDPEFLQQMQGMYDEKMAAQQPETPDPTAGLVEVEQIKSQVKIEELKVQSQLDMMKLDFTGKQKMIELLMRDDFDRDKLRQELAIEASKINVDMLKQEEVLRAQRENQSAQLEQADRQSRRSSATTISGQQAQADRERSRNDFEASQRDADRADRRREFDSTRASAGKNKA